MLKLATVLPVCLPVYGLIAGDPGKSTLSWLKAGSGLQGSVIAGDLLLVDASVNTVTGDGLYLYPDWGNPAVYEVRETRPGSLDFYAPGTGDPLWRSSMGSSMDQGGEVFAGRIEGIISRSQREQIVRLMTSLPELWVPALPV